MNGKVSHGTAEHSTSQHRPHNLSQQAEEQLPNGKSFSNRKPKRNEK